MLTTTNSFTKFSVEQKELLKRTFCKETTDDEMRLFEYACVRTGLDPFVKQIYMIVRGKGPARAATLQTSIDGLRAIADRTRRYSPGSPTIFQYDSNKKLVSATAFVKKMTHDGVWHEVSAPAYYDEYVQAYNGVPSKFWDKMPHVMLAKCAEALALRKAFPYEMAGLYTSEEMHNSLNTDKGQEDMLEETKLIKEAEIIHDDVQFEVPEGIDMQLVEQYLSYVASNFKGMTMPQCKMKVQENLPKFWEKFHVWMTNNHPDY